MTVKKAYIFIFLIILIDQISKVYVKTNFILHEEVSVFSWFKILFVENEGMAWGAQLPGEYGKLALTVFRILISPVIMWWLWDSIKKEQSKFLIVAICLILAGALGNLIDSIFYGVMFNDSGAQVATIFSNEPYGRLLYGNVVDMFYFPIWKGDLPEWLPIVGGKPFTFFNAIFNVADVAISTGFGILIVFNKKCFK
ncbi:lipoprotein signal peptidase [Flavobacterium urocaniciphilum]|uniref:Lipoprotein signal peptidase n=1 Tax=Flavobacterium urocaniciphilum TaxID=1299341 RepID=A0A1H9BV94_9FLAO|nr:lipoprotein signal peptidase [Flavobacterium urocaniciphilum]SEP92767.1 signal peptidase II [Flavobacterium urocaniciphilum]